MLRAAGYAGLKTAVFKPITVGCSKVEGRLQAFDVMEMMASCTIQLKYDEVNPIAFAPPVPLHLTSRKVGDRINPDLIEHGHQQLLNKEPDPIVVEGTGGWKVPLNEHAMLSDFVVKHRIPVVLVVGLKPGCLNHALLTVDAIRADGLTLMGWVADQISPDTRYMRDTVLGLDNQLDAPCLGVLSRFEEPDEAIEYLDLREVL